MQKLAWILLVVAAVTLLWHWTAQNDYECRPVDDVTEPSEVAPIINCR